MRPPDSPEDWQHFPDTTVQKLTRPLSKFLRIEAASGVLLAICAVVALVIANSGYYEGWKAFWDTKLTIGTGSFELSYELWYWVNDALMAIFFFVVGLEIKRELVDGHLSDRRKIVLPVVGALGGAAIPALVFFALQSRTPGEQGWAIPMATDIAFVVGALALLGKRVPASLKILVLSLAIVDDLMAVLVIALFYAEQIYPSFLAASAACIGIILFLQVIGVRRVGIYIIAGSVLWLCTLKSGLHPTIAGVILGMLTPSRPWVSKESLRKIVDDADKALDQEAATGVSPAAALERLSFGAKASVSPLERLEHSLHPWVGFVIMPIFALANSGVRISGDSLTSPLAIAIAVALFFGKPLGIVGAAWIAIKTKRATLPDSVGWGAMWGAGVLCGIGFTMSLFITSLSFPGDLGDPARMGVMLGSAISLVVGMVLLIKFLPNPDKKNPPSTY